MSQSTLRGVELRLLEAAVAVADELHFGRAARRLGIAQPPLSQRIQRLERVLGVRLFDRDRQGVGLTPQGTAVVDAARRVLAEVDRLSTLADGLRTGVRGTLTVGAVGSAFYEALPELLGPVRQALPELELHVTEVESPEQVDALLSGELDVGFLRPPADRRLRVRTVWREPLVAAVPADHSLAHRTSVDITALADESIVFFPRDRGPGFWDQVGDAFRSEGLELSPVAEADHATTMLGLVSLAMGVTIVPASARVLHLTGVRYLELVPTRHLDLAVAVPRDAHGRGAAVHRFLDALPRQPRCTGG